MAREYRRYRVMTILRIKNEGYWRITVGKRYLSWNPQLPGIRLLSRQGVMRESCPKPGHKEKE